MLTNRSVAPAFSTTPGTLPSDLGELGVSAVNTPMREDYAN